MVLFTRRVAGKHPVLTVCGRKINTFVPSSMSRLRRDAPASDHAFCVLCVSSERALLFFLPPLSKFLSVNVEEECGSCLWVLHRWEGFCLEDIKPGGRKQSGFEFLSLKTKEAGLLDSEHGK